MKRTLLKLIRLMSITILALAILLTATTVLYMRQAKFGSAPSGQRLERIKTSPHYKDGKFQNILHTPQLTEGYGYWEVMYDFFFVKHPRKRPVDTIPSIKTDLHFPADSNVLVWFGHSSYFIQLNGKKILVDPVFSGNASPVPGSNKAFNGTDRYTVDDLPTIDYLFISHDHYDHLDYETILKLKGKVQHVICGLGVGAHFERWGYDSAIIHEKDWYETIAFDSSFTIHTTPARHFSGRGFSPNNTLWMSYVLQTPSFKIYIGGDSGYGTHFKEIGEKFGPIDLVILEDGQYNVKWRYIHLQPEEVLQAARDLNAKRLFPVHSSKFALATHPWDEPLIQVSDLNKNNIPLVTPIIGEVVNLDDINQPFKQWWVGLR